MADRDGELTAYPSVDAVVVHLEAVDVVAGEYVAFDLSGQVLELRALGEDIEIVGTGRNDLDGLRRHLLAHGDRLGLDYDPGDPVAAANALLRHDWEARWPRWPRWLAVRLHGAAPPQVPAVGTPDGER